MRLPASPPEEEDEEHQRMACRPWRVMKELVLDSAPRDAVVHTREAIVCVRCSTSTSQVKKQ